MFGIAGACSCSNREHERLCDALCRAHWPRLFTMARQRGWDAHEAEDAVQELFEGLVRRGLLTGLIHYSLAKQSCHLTVRMKCHLANRWRNKHRQRRGGHDVFVPLHDDETGANEVAGEDTPATVLDRIWFILALERALARLRAEMKPDAWRRVEPWFHGCGFTERGQQSGAARVTLHRARTRLRDLLSWEQEHGTAAHRTEFCKVPVKQDNPAAQRRVVTAA